MLIKLHVRQFSTGDAHPAAAKSKIDVGTSRNLPAGEKLSVTIEVVGPYLILLLTWTVHDDDDNELTDRLILFNWCTGQRIVVRHPFDKHSASNR